MARLSREYYLGDTVELAKDLLGKVLVREWNGERLICRITETEAYVGRIDKACHAYGYHRTPRNSILFAEPGHAYIYFIYGMYCCLNFVTEPVGEPSAILIRAMEPLSGADTIRRLRFGDQAEHLTPYQRKNFLNGPGKLCKGLSLTTAENGMDLTGNTLYVCEDPADVGLPSLPRHRSIGVGPRVGIDYAEEAKDFPWRFWLKTED